MDTATRSASISASTRSAPSFTVRSGGSSLRALFIAALCAFIVTSFLLDLNGSAPAGAANPVELRT
jgi:hypothetical protein